MCFIMVYLYYLVLQEVYGGEMIVFLLDKDFEVQRSEEICWVLYDQDINIYV